MQIISLIFLIVCGFAGLYLLFHFLREFNNLTMKEVAFGRLLKNSIFGGIAGSLLFFCVIMIVGFLDKNYIWSFNKYLGALLISLIPGVIIFIGSLIQTGLVIQFRKVLVNFLKNKSKK
jgi:ABC-type Fe3+ transport system permease subunit